MGLVLMFPLSMWVRVVLRPHKVVVPLLVAHSHVLPFLRLCLRLLVHVFQGGGVPPPIDYSPNNHLPTSTSRGIWTGRGTPPPWNTRTRRQKQRWRKERTWLWSTNSSTTTICGHNTTHPHTERGNINTKLKQKIQ